MVHKGILFDFDGVVGHVDIGKVLEQSMLFKDCFRLPLDEILDRYFYRNPYNAILDTGDTTVGAVRETFRNVLWNGTPENYHDWWQMVEDAYRLSGPMRELLDSLHYGYKLVLITDNHIGFRDWLTRRTDIGAYFTELVCSAELGIKKPHRTIYETAVRHIGATFEDVLYIDDDIQNVHEATEMGITSIHFESDLKLSQRIYELLT